MTDAGRYQAFIEAVAEHGEALGFPCYCRSYEPHWREHDASCPVFIRGSNEPRKSRSTPVAASERAAKEEADLAGNLLPCGVCGTTTSQHRKPCVVVGGVLNPLRAVSDDASGQT